MNEAVRATPPGKPEGPPRTSALVVLGACAALAVPGAWLILTGNNAGRAAFDATAYHIRFIRQLAADFPDFDLSNPLTATTPGYHMVLATVARLGADSTAALRVASLAIGLLLVGVFAAWCSRRAARLEAALLSMPLAASVYVLGSAAWTAPDNLAWLLVASIVLICLRGTRGRWDLATASLLLVGLVSVRQIHIWCAAVIWAAAWSDARVRGATISGAIRATVPWLLATVPALLVLGYFVWKWGGLAPPRFQGEVQGFSLPTPAFVLLQIAILAVGFSPWIAPRVRDAWREDRGRILVVATAGLLLALVPTTTASFADGRFGGWWGLAARLPVLFERSSVLVLAGAPVGAVVLHALLARLDGRTRLVTGTAVLGFVLAMTANHYCWQRYHEPFLLLLIPVMILSDRHPRADASRLGLLPPVALLLLLGVIAFTGVRGEPVPDDATPAPSHIAPSDRFDEGKYLLTK